MKILEKQVWHGLGLAVLLAGVAFLARGEVLAGSYLGVSTRAWLWLSILVPVIHQIYVVLCWRAELYYQSLSKTWGEKAFLIWSVGFMILFLARPLLVLFLSLANRDTLDFPIWGSRILAGLFLGLVLFLGYSVARFFGIRRALGWDHFHPQQAKELPLVESGIYAWSPNSMYLFGFLFLWIPGLILLSKAALLAAAFNHLYVWVHYYFTEAPDMKYIYGSSKT